MFTGWAAGCCSTLRVCGIAAGWRAVRAGRQDVICGGRKTTRGPQGSERLLSFRRFRAFLAERGARFLGKFADRLLAFRGCRGLADVLARRCALLRTSHSVL